MKRIFDRIGKNINISRLSSDICEIYGLGCYVGYKLIDVGCDDLSYYLLTENAKYIVKIFNKYKSKEDFENFVKIYELFIKNRVRTPKLIKNNTDDFVLSIIFEEINVNLCVLECIDGKDLYSLNKKITKEDIDKLVNLIVSIHRINAKYKIKYDNYSFIKLKENFEKNKSMLPKWLINDISVFLECYNKIDFTRLPNCFIHTDLASTNIIKDKKNKLYVIDYASAGSGIRILDIVVCINRCIFDYTDIDYSLKMEKYFIEKYQKYIKLEEYELSILNILKKANAYACFILEYVKFERNKTKENQYWYDTDLKIIQNTNIEILHPGFNQSVI